MPGNFNFFSNITFIKLIAIIYVTIIYAIGGLIITISTDRYLIKPYYDKSEGAEEKISTKQHIIETVIIYFMHIFSFCKISCMTNIHIIYNLVFTIYFINNSIRIIYFSFWHFIIYFEICLYSYP